MLKTHATLESRCKVVSSVFDSSIENHRTPIKSEQCEINVYPQDRAFDCAHIPSDCNDRAIRSAANKKSRLSTHLRRESGLKDVGIQICSYQNISSTSLYKEAS